jgi:putative hemolysin
MNRVFKFKPKIKMFLEVGDYTVKTVENPVELIECFRLRHQVFANEFKGIEKEGMDFDRFDYHFDHLAILHRPTNKIIGTYRLNCSGFSNESYTETEFDISSILKSNKVTLELGRACIRKDFRKGVVISLLWRGIAEYMNLSGSDLLFGCSSIKITNPRDAALIHTYFLNSNAVTETFQCRPQKKYVMKDLASWMMYFRMGLNDDQNAEAAALVPTLLKSYLKLGAKIAGVPAFDKDFACIDLLTVLRKEDLAVTVASRFNISTPK